MARGLSILAAAAAGAAATYLLDAQEGGRRRALLRDKLQGKLSRLEPDGVLAERVRSKLGRLLAHPGSIDVSVVEGAVTLRGPVLKREVKRALRGVAAVRGVKRVENLLEAHVPDIAQASWSPATRFLMGAGGAAAIAYGLARRSPIAALLALGGAAALARAGTNMDMKRLLGRRGRRSIELQNSIHIAAPPEEIYRFWSNFENFPQFMRNVLSVRRNSDDTQQLIAWATVPGWNVQHSGVVRFRPEGRGTRVEIHMAYNPVAGALGHFAAWLAGRDPQREMDEDLMRLKTYFESGTPARDAAQPLHRPL